MKVNSNNKASLRVRNSEAKEVDRFTYLGANVTKDDVVLLTSGRE